MSESESVGKDQRDRIATLLQELADEDGLLITNWIVVVSCTSVELDEEGSTSYITFAPTRQPYHASLGLVAYLKLRLDEKFGRD